MAYLIVVVAGVAIGLFTPLRFSPIRAVLFSGLFVLAVAGGLSFLLSYDTEQVLSLLRLEVDSTKDPIGLMPLVGIGYMFVLGVLIAAIRYAIGRNDS